jgi:hypothetical protein
LRLLSRLSLLLFLFLFVPVLLKSQPKPLSNSTVVFAEPDFPAVDTAPVSPPDLLSLPDVSLVNAAQLSSALASPSAKLLIISGSAFPEEAWDAIYSFLQRGGNLLALGGRPFAQAAYRHDAKWSLRPERNVFMHKLFINDYAQTPGSQTLQFELNPDYPKVTVPKFSWNRAWSMAVKLSGEDLYPRGGSTGTLDTTIHALAWGSQNGHHLAAPVVEMDHFQNNFVGGRWEIVAADLPAGFFGSAAGHQLVSGLAQRALEGAGDFSLRPRWALFLPGEPLSFQFTLRQFSGSPQLIRLELTVAPDHGEPVQKTIDLAPGQFPYITEVDLPAPSETGFHVVTARLMQNGAVRGIYRTGFWIRDHSYLASGPRVTVNNDFFEIDGQPTPILGSNYMASDVQRDFFMLPNPYIWEHDFSDMQRNGVNMVRSGWWSAWDQVMKEEGVLHEESLRAIEAYLMTARRHNMPVQFNLFAFIPDVFGGGNPYLNAEALRRQKTFVAAVAERFKDVPWLIWDLINEPSFDKPAHLWATRANGDAAELAQWNNWLHTQYSDNGAIAAAWNTMLTPAGAQIAAPNETDFNLGSAGKPLIAHDFYRFAQEEFKNWTAQMRDAIRNTGSKQLITVGQDEGGIIDRLNPSFWGEALDFTTNHTWWRNDALLWDSLAPKYPGKPLLIQETGLQNDFGLDDTWRLTPQEQSNLLERKLAIAVATTAGGIEWLWNLNGYMTEDAEVSIGMVRDDGTNKPDVAMFRSLAEFVANNREEFRAPETPQVAILTSQSFQYSPLNQWAVAAQQKSVRVLHNYLGVPAYMVAENQIAKLGNPRLLIVPSPQALPQSTWEALLRYAESGGTVLVTGSMERDPHWVTTHRMKDLGIDAAREDLTFRQGTIRIQQQAVSVAFVDQKWFDALRFADGSTWKEIPRAKGRLLITAYPVELAEGNDSATTIYKVALERAGVTPAFESRQILPGVLIRPTIFADSVLYLFMSESGLDEDVDVADKLTGARLNFSMPSQRARLVLLRRKDGKVLARYGF